jgi:hypothetical protein
MAKSRAELLHQIESDPFMNAYLECIVFTEESLLEDEWSSYREQLEADSDEELDLPDYLDWSYSDIDAKSLKEIIADCEGFMDECAEADIDLEEDWGLEEAGHDFWLTRNGHGAGFWDRGKGGLGNKLTEMAKAYGSVRAVIADCDVDSEFGFKNVTITIE